MNLHEKYNLKKIINAKGVYTPLGVSRTSDDVANTTALALKQYFEIDELLKTAGDIIAKHCGAQSATIVHCASAANILAIAGTMTGRNAERIAQLPDTAGMKNKVVIFDCHLINYGHPVEQDIRQAGAKAIIAGNRQGCSHDEFITALNEDDVAAMLYVNSRLTRGKTPDLDDCIAAAHQRNIPFIMDAAAMDMRMSELVVSGADMLTFSAQKYLSAPTAGILVGKESFVQAVNAQTKGIGRPMKPSKEAIIGTIAAVEARAQIDMEQWSEDKKREAQAFANNLGKLEHVKTSLEKGLAYGDFWRVELRLDNKYDFLSVKDIAEKLRAGEPSIYCGDYRLNEGILEFELISLNEQERETIIKRISEILAQAKNTRS